VGAREYVNAVRKHPLARALRVGKMTVAALEATLREYLDPEAALESVPALRMLSEPENSVRRRARRLKQRIDRSETSGITCRLVDDVSRAGGGSLPIAEISTCCLAVTHSGLSAPDLEKHLRGSDPAVLPRVKDDTVLLDLRTVSDDEVTVLAGIIASIDR
jgi:L-seryl-tRNA(Ser) seleniumtransferase